MALFLFFTNHKISNKLFILLGCVTSFMLIAFTQSILPDKSLWVKVGMSFAIGTILIFIIVWLLNMKWFQNMITKITHRTPNASIWRDVLDLNKGANVKVYFKDNNDYYLTGYLHTVDEKNEKWICIAGFSKWNIIDDEHYMGTLGYEDDETAKYLVEIDTIEHIELFDGE